MVELDPHNIDIWNLYCRRIQPMATRTTWQPIDGKWKAVHELDWNVVLQLIRLYPLDSPMRMVDRIAAISEGLTMD